MQLTLKLPVVCSPQAEFLLLETIKEYTESYNRVAKIGWDTDCRNEVELHKKTYFPEREKTKLQSQLVCSARVKAHESLKSAWRKLKKGKKASCPFSYLESIRYDHRCSMIRIDKEFATLSTIGGRVKVDLRICDYYKQKVDWEVKTADLVFRDKKLYLHVVVEKEDPKFEFSENVIGVDLGVNRPAVTSDNKFFGERRWKNIEQKAFRLKRSLQAKGTKSAKKHLMRICGRINSFRNDCDHVLSKRLVKNAPLGTVIVLEDLTDIRDRVSANRKTRRRIHSWSFNRLQDYLAYKSKMNGVLVEYVNPKYTSQKCSRCDDRKASYRVSQSLFHCQKCGYQLNADLNASRNIRKNYLAHIGIADVSGLQSISLSSPTAGA